MQNRPPIRDRSNSEDGFMLVMAIFMVFLLMLSLSVAMPQIIKQLQRDREVETMQRGLQYRRAIQLYYRKFNAYPPSIDSLVKSNNIRFLRKKYVDPMTGKDDWKMIGLGQNKAPLAMGFFGQPLAGVAGGANPFGGGMAGAGGLPGTPGTGFGGASNAGGLGSTGSIFGGSSNTGSSGTLGSIFGSTNTGSTSTAGTGTTGGTSANGGTGTGTGTGSTTSSTFGSTSGQTFGGGVVGVEPPGTASKQSILVYKKKNHYNEWEFTYSPLSEQKSIMGSSGPTGLPGSGTNQNGNGFGGTTGGLGGSTGGFGGSSGGFGGSSGGFGGSAGGFGGSSGGFGGSNNGPGTSPSPAPQQNPQF